MHKRNILSYSVFAIKHNCYRHSQLHNKRLQAKYVNRQGLHILQGHQGQNVAVADFCLLLPCLGKCVLEIS